ncbi:MAG: PfkB family carbohydrate kinase, partial [Pseudomonadota bacterium]
MILIDDSGDRTILGFERPLISVAFPDLDLNTLDAIYMSAERTVSPDVAQTLADSQIPVVAALGHAHQLTWCDIVVASDQNFDSYEGADWWGALSRRGIKTRWLVVTLDKRGVWATDGTTVLTMPASPAAHVVDTTGAGDAFAAGLVYATARDWPIEAALALGSQWGADAVSHLESGCPRGHKPNVGPGEAGVQITRTRSAALGNLT